MAARTLKLVSGGADPSDRENASDAGAHPLTHATDTLPDAVIRERPLGPGDVVDRYRIDRMIAAGGMARVYRAVHQFTGRVVALKVMRTRYADRPELIEQFQTEAMALTRIRHANVVTIENGGLTEKGEVFIAMELLDGRTLREVLMACGRLALDETLDLVCQVARGVAAAHDSSVIHRDLKPENIFCTREAGVRVLDLGLAKFVDFGAEEADPAPAPIGTAAYMSPERLDGMPVDVRGDIYSLGLIAYECLAGHHPLVPEPIWPSREEVALRQLTYQPEPLRAAPPEVASIVMRAMSKSPTRRFASMHEFVAALEQARATLAGVASASHAPASTPSPVSSAPSVAATALAERERKIARRAVLTGAVVGLVFGVSLFLVQRYFGAEQRAAPEVPSLPAVAAAPPPAAQAPPPVTPPPAAVPAPPALAAPASAVAEAAPTPPNVAPPPPPPHAAPPEPQAMQSPPPKPKAPVARPRPEKRRTSIVRTLPELPASGL